MMELNQKNLFPSGRSGKHSGYGRDSGRQFVYSLVNDYCGGGRRKEATGQRDREMLLEMPGTPQEILWLMFFLMKLVCLLSQIN